MPSVRSVVDEGGNSKLIPLEGKVILMSKQSKGNMYKPIEIWSTICEKVADNHAAMGGHPAK
eukprot:6727640-Ditylum_brightwellii.AAC.1